MRTNTDVTLYTRSFVLGAETWTRSVIRDVAWEDRKAANVLQSGLLEADRATVYIPTARGATVRVGDVLVKGEVTKTISVSYTMTNLRADYTVIAVRSVDTMDMGSAVMHHVQIGGS